MLKKLVDEYEYTPTEKQRKLLGNDIGKLTYKETFDAISEKKSEWSLSTLQKIELLRSVLGSLDVNDGDNAQLALNRIKQIIDRDITYITDINHNEYIKIINVTNPFISVKNNICKDHPISYDNGYEYGWQVSDKCEDNRLYYLRFYHLMMMDFDYKYFNEIDIDRIESKLNEHNLSGRLYSTNAGYHLFITSVKIHHRDCKMIGMLFDQSDYRYLSFAMKFGYKVRLNRKIGDTNEVKYVCRLGTAPELEYLTNLIKIHDFYIEKHL